MQTTKTTSKAPPIRRGRIPRPQKATLFGPPGVGKTTLGSQLPDPVIIDTEGGSHQLDVARMVVSDWESITAAVEYLATQDHGFRTVVFDTVGWLEKRLAEHLCRKFGKESIEDFGFGKGYVLLAEEFARFLASLDALLAKGLHVVFLAHSAVRKFEAPDQAGSYDRYELKLTKQCAPLLKEWADALVFANYVTRVAEKDNGRMRGVGGKERVLLTTHSAAYDAKNRHGLADKLPFSIDALEPLFGFFDIGDRTFMPAPPDSGPQTLTDRIFAAFQHKANMAEVVDFLVARGQLHFTVDGPLESIDNLDPAYAERMTDSCGCWKAASSRMSSLPSPRQASRKTAKSRHGAASRSLRRSGRRRWRRRAASTASSVPSSACSCASTRCTRTAPATMRWPRSAMCSSSLTATRRDKPIPKQEQYAAVVASGMPVAALIDSGNKSLHAWIRVDAPDDKEYKRRVAVIWEWFSGLNLDKQNRNPSRLSRCPGGWRTVDGEPKSQSLLQLQFGAISWDAWESAQNAPPVDSFIPVSTLAAYDTAHDPNNVLGQRWLCRGGSLVVVGQSGIGKSSLCMQLMILWALGLPAFGITPIAPLRSVLIQAENDIGDLAEMYQGVRKGMGLTPEHEALLDERIFIYRDTTRTGEDFVDAASALVERHKPDLVWADPLLNYIGDDISEQRVISQFCCSLLNEVSLRTGVIWCLLHHTGKPSKDPKAGTHWTASDLAYSGLGSSALTNWSRETAVLVRVKTAGGEPPTFQFSMTKRRKRAGLTDTAGESTDTIFLRHATNGGICWEQCEPPVVDDPKSTGRYKMGRKSGFDPEAFKAVLTAHGGSLTKGNMNEVAAKMKCSPRTAWNWWKKLKNNDL